MGEYEEVKRERERERELERKSDGREAYKRANGRTAIIPAFICYISI